MCVCVCVCVCVRACVLGPNYWERGPLRIIRIGAMEPMQATRA